jgi:hypothetical protein
VRFQLQIDGLVTEISTRDPELLGRWLLEQFALIRWTPATHVVAHAWPSWSDFTEDGRPRADWLTDSRELVPWEVKSPEDVVMGLMETLGRSVRGEVPSS